MPFQSGRSSRLPVGYRPVALPSFLFHGTFRSSSSYRVAQIMMEHTDEEHFITMPQLIGELEKYGITADRKSLYADLRDLEIMGIEVEGEKVGNGYHYHVINRPFELPELKLLRLIFTDQFFQFFYKNIRFSLCNKLRRLDGIHQKL